MASTKKVLQTSVRTSAVIIAISLIGMAILAPIAHFGILSGMVVEGDISKTAENVMSNQPVFLAAALLLFIVAVLDIIVAQKLKTFFAPVKSKLVEVMSLARIIYAVVFMLAIAYLVTPVLMDHAGVGVAATDVSYFVMMFYSVWAIALLVFGAHLVALAWLFYKVTYTPVWLAGLLLVAGLGYAIDSIGALLITGYSIEISMVSFIGEVALILWLLIVGRRIVLRKLK